MKDANDSKHYQEVVLQKLNIEFCKHHIDRVSYKARYYVFENQDDKTDVNFLRYSAFRKGIGLGKSV